MRHKVSGKKLSRNREERLALQRALTFSLIEQFGQDKEFITTSVVKAKWVRSFAEKCITLGVKGYREMQKAADANGTSVDELKRQQTEEKKKFKDFSPKVREHLAKSIHFRRQAAKKLGATRVQDPYERQRGARPRSHKALQALFDGVAQRYLERPGGYLRVLRTSQRQLGDGTQKAVLGFVGGPLEVEA